MSKRITIEELQSYLWNSAVLLRTNIDAGAYKQYIFPLLFFKRICDVYDEETAAAREEYGDDAAEFDEDEIHTFIVPKGYHWNDVRAVSENVGVAIVEAFRKVENANSDKLQGIFGDGAWTNKNRLPDRLLKDLLEHFSTKTLSIANCPEDELGQGYEYLIKKFADDSGHTAQEFYTNRTVVHLMTEMLKPESGESIYDPTCGSAGMLISAIAYLKAQGKEWRNVAVYGQEINALTSAIGKMNLFLHGVKDFSIVNGDTLASPAFIEHGRLQQFDLVLANPPYSISQWDRAAFESDTEKELRLFARDYFLYLWCGKDSPLFDKSKMATFERYFLTDKATFKEEKGYYFQLRDSEEVVDRILDAFGVKGDNRHIINGHVPVHASKGENPIKANGKLMVIDGGFSQAYHSTTGIAGYTLVYHSRGFQLVQHEPFTSASEAIEKGTDIKSTTQLVELSAHRMLVADTDRGAELREQIDDLRQLLYAYRHGIITEAK